MELKRISELLAGILLELPGCPSITASQSLLRAAQEWYRETLAWKYEAEFVTADGVRVYVLTPPTCSHILLLRGITDDNDNPFTVDYVFDGNREVTFCADVKPDQTCTADLALCPSNSAAELPCTDASRYLHIWEHGALAKLRMQKDQPWYSPNDAAFHAQQFRAGIMSSRIDEVRGYQTVSLRVRPNRFL